MNEVLKSFKENLGQMCFGHARQSDFFELVLLLILKRSEMIFFNSKQGQKNGLAYPAGI